MGDGISLVTVSVVSILRGRRSELSDGMYFWSRL
jgi:hypothetical protein